MEVRPGYKQTEVGVIPEDWEVHSSVTVDVHDKGHAAGRHVTANDGCGCIRSQNLTSGGRLDFDDRWIVRPSKSGFEQTSWLQRDDVLDHERARVGTVAVSLTSELEWLFDGSGSALSELESCGYVCDFSLQVRSGRPSHWARR